MIELAQSRTKRMMAIHGWSSVILGLMLYVVILTGAIVVFAYELGVWSKGSSSAGFEIVEPIDHMVRKASREVNPDYLEEVSVRKNSEGNLTAFFHSHVADPETGQIADIGAYYVFDLETRETLSVQEGLSSEIFIRDPNDALVDFLLDLHINLYVPRPWGLYLTGIAGMLMLFVAISGVLMHRHLIRDIFLAPRKSLKLSSVRDRHILAGVWSVPFAIVLAFTGAFFSFLGAFAVPLVAMVAFGGDVDKLVETVQGHQEEVDMSPEPLASLDSIVLYSTKTAGTAPTSITIHHYGAKGAEVLVSHPTADGDLFGRQYAFDGPTRKALGEKPVIGTEPSAGSTLLSLMAPLHFGNFADFTSKIVWLALGAAGAFVTITGLRLWVRRREEDLIWQRYGRSVTIVGWGLPIAIIGCSYTFFLSVPAGDPGWWTPAGFFLTSAIAIAVGVGKEDPTRRYRMILAVMVLGLPLIRHLTGGMSWADSIVEGHPEVLSVDLLLLLSGYLLLRPPKLPEEAPLSADDHGTMPEAAE